MSAAHYAIDLARARPPASRWGAVLFVLGLAATAASATAWYRAHAAHEDGVQTLSRLSTALAARGAASQAAAVQTPSAAERRLMADLSRVGGDLHKPWFPLFDALEASETSPVRLQQLSVDSAFTKLQLQVDAPGLPEVLHYLHTLESAGPALQSVQLLGHEWQTPAANGSRRLQARIAVVLVARSAVDKALP